MNNIKISVKGREYEIPNSWDAVTPQTWLNFCHNLRLVETGELSVGELRIRLLCDIMGWRWQKMRDEETIANLVVLSEQLTFPFRIQYPDNNAALQSLSDDDYRKAVRHEPDHLSIAAAPRLQQLDWHYQADLCFVRQMVPVLTVDGTGYDGYRAELHDGALSLSLTALQYIHACEALDNRDGLHRLAAILYAPQPYDAEQAHELALRLRDVETNTLRAVRMNFQAVTNFLFTKTPFSLLTKFEHGSKTKSITTTMGDALYDLCADGLGGYAEVEQLNVLTYLRILRKKTIDSVRQLHGMQMDIARIANETGLPPSVITEIV